MKKNFLTLAALLLSVCLPMTSTGADYRQLQPKQAPVIMQPPQQGGAGMMVPGAPAAPEIRAVNPPVVSQGGSYTLQLIGVGLQQGMALDFGPGIQVTGTPALNGTVGSVGVQVAPNASIGPHDVKIIYSGRTTTALAKLVVTAGVQMDIMSVSPQTLMRGKQQTVTLNGTNLKKGMSLSMGAGIEVSSIQQVGDNLMMAAVNVGPDAPLGPHEVMMDMGGGRTKKATATVIVIAGAPSPGEGMPSLVVAPGAVPVAAATVLSVVPNNWEPGKSYQVVLSGLGFSEGMDIRFGNGVEVKSLSITGPTAAKAEVSVAGGAAPGARVAELKRSAETQWKSTAATAWVVSLKKAPLAEIPQIGFKAPDVIAFQKGQIYLEFPRWGDFENVEVKQNYGVPKVNDKTVFEWKERNPGTADWFEFRLLRTNGDVLLTKKVTDTYYRPEPEFIKQLWDILKPAVSGQLQPPNAGQVLQAGGATLPGGKVQDTKTLTDQEKYIYDHWQEIGLFWEVAGYKTYKKTQPQQQQSGQAGQSGGVVQAGAGQVYLTTQGTTLPGGAFAQSVDVQVEISERWPLSNKASRPTGMACGQGQGTLMTQKIGGDPKDLVLHPFDIIQLSGNFNLGNSPWNVSVLDQWDHSTESLIDVKEYKFNNVFVDWGDGTVVPLSSNPEDKHTYYDGKTLSVKMTHIYKWVDQFTVRVYVLPVDDLPLLGEIADANGQDNPLLELLKAFKHAKAEGASPVYAEEAAGRRILLAALDTPVTDAGGTLVAAAGIQQGGQVQPASPDMFEGASGGQKFSPSGVSPQMGQANPVAPPVLGAMDRAYMAYCNVLDIRSVMDTDATGPLHLDWIEINSFSGQAEAAKTGVVSAGQAGKTVKATAGAVPKAGQPKGDAGGLEQVVSGLGAIGQGAAKALTAAGGTSKQLTAVESAAAKVGLNIPYDARATTCDEGLIATAELSYYGTGRARVTWNVEGVTFSEELDLASEPREGLPADKSKWGEPKRSIVTVTSPVLPVDKAGYHKVTVDAMVLPANKPETIDTAALMGVLQKMMGQGGGSPGKTAPPGDSSQGGKPGGMKPQVIPITQQGGGVNFGVISNANKITESSPVVQYVNQGALSQSIVMLMQPPWYVSSEEKTYLVVQPDPEYPCVFHFPVAGGGYFKVTSLQGNVKKDASGRWNGHGTLLFRLPVDETAYKTYFTDVKISGWEVVNDVDVKTGEINISGLGLTIDTLPGMKASVGKLAAKPGEDMTATMDITVGSPELKLVSNNSPKAWPGLSSKLTPEGDWYKPGQKLDETYIGWSLFKISSDDARIDLSHAEGDSPGGGNQSSWVGIHLGPNASLAPYLLDLQNLTVPATGWTIAGGGISGNASMGAFNHDMGEGNIHFDSMNVSCKDNDLSATYKGVKVHVPWPDVTLSGGDAHLVYGPGGADIKFNFASAGSFKLKYGPVDMTVNNIEFKKGKPGWGISADTTFDYWDGTYKFASVAMSGLFFNMLGVASFEDGMTNHSYGLSGQSKLGKAPLTLKSVTITPASSTDRLMFAIITDLNISKKLSNAQVQVNYSIKRNVGNYYSTGPENSPFSLYVEYPAGSPEPLKTKISPELSPPGGGSADAGTMYASLYAPGDDGVVSDAYGPVMVASSGSYTDTYVGSVNTKMFGMAQEIQALFRLGYVGDDDYWITYASYSPHLTIFPGVQLDTIGGGLGYNFGKDAYTTNPATATPVISDSMLYSADLRVSDPSNFAYSVHGVLTISPGQGIYRMDFLDVKLLGINNIGQGFFEYGDGHFEGAVWGGLTLFGGFVSLTIPQGDTGIYFSKQKWEVKAGGQGHMIIMDTNVSMALGSETGLKMTGGFSYSTGKICLGVISGRFSIDGNIGFQVDTSASLHTVAGIHASCKVCAACYKPCGSLGAGVDLHIDLPPLALKLCVDLDCPWPVPDYSGCFGI